MKLKIIYGYIPKDINSTEELQDFKEEYEDNIQWNPIFLGKVVSILDNTYLDVSLLDKKHFVLNINFSETNNIKKSFNNLPERISKHFIQKPGFYIISNE